MKKVCVYIDGFNVFHALKQSFWKKYYWLNYKQLSRAYLEHWDHLVEVYYFSALFYSDPEGVERHKEYIRVLQKKWVKIILWKYQERESKFNKKHNKVLSIAYDGRVGTHEKGIKQLPIPDQLIYSKFEEKRTDVNMAVQIVMDWLRDKYDKAIIITWDSDIAPAVEAIKRVSNKEFVSVIPVWKKRIYYSKYLLSKN